MSFSPAPPPEKRTKGLGKRGGGSSGARCKKCLTSPSLWTLEYSPWSLVWKEEEAPRPGVGSVQHPAPRPCFTLSQVVVIGPRRGGPDDRKSPLAWQSAQFRFPPSGDGDEGFPAPSLRAARLAPAWGSWRRPASTKALE